MAHSADRLRWCFGGLNPASETTPLLSTHRRDSEHILPTSLRCVFPNNGLLSPDQRRVLVRFPGNKIQTTKYTLLSFLPKNLFHQFHRLANLYFLFLVILNWFPQMEVFHREITMLPLVVVTAISSFKDALEDFKRYKFDKVLNLKRTTVYDW
ncbi:putative phospholipid-transporting ATPase VB isoform X1 [Arapaima gigas]